MAIQFAPATAEVGCTVKKKAFARHGTVKATHKESGLVVEMLVRWGEQDNSNFVWEKPEDISDCWKPEPESV